MADDFDPDKYLAEKQQGGDFDPDAYLAAKTSGGPVKFTKVAADLGATGTAAAHFARHGSFGLGDKLTAAVMAIQDKLADKTGTVTFGDAYNRDLGLFDRSIEASDQAHPTARWVGNAAGVLGSGALLSPLAAAQKGRTLYQTMKAGIAPGMALGAVGSFGADRSDGATGTAVNMGVGTVLGGALGFAAPAAAAGLGALARDYGAPVVQRLRGGYIKPTPEAQRLIDQGVKLTLGKMDPGSAFGRVEELAANKVTGGSLDMARQRAASETRDVLLRLAGAPGATPPSAGTPVAQQLDELAKGFSRAYDGAIGDARIQPDQYLGAGKWRGLVTDEGLQGAAKLKGAFELAAESPNINASDGVRKQALDWLRNEATSLTPTKSGPNAGTVEARAVQQLRTRLRDEIRSLGSQGDDRATKEILKRAEGFVSELLEGQLPPENAAALKATDAAYRNIIAVKDAAKRAFVPNEEFTPAQLLQAIRKTGSSPALEATARDAQSVLAARYPLTGIQVAANESLPLLNKVGPAWAAFVNASPFWRNHAINQMVAPGVPARVFSAIGRGLESTAMSPVVRPELARTLADLIARRRPQALADNSSGNEFDQFAVAP